MLLYDKEDKNNIIDAFLDNKIVIMLTDTVYGIMAIANKNNELRINKVKRSNLDKKISIIFPNKNLLNEYLCDINEDKWKIIGEKLPGKYTFIVNLRKFSDFNRDDFGVRVTGNEYLQDILESVGPVLASSCNISGDKICNSLEEIKNVFGNDDVIVVKDENAASGASTIIDIRDDIKVIRN